MDRTEPSSTASACEVTPGHVPTQEGMPHPLQHIPMHQGSVSPPGSDRSSSDQVQQTAAQKSEVITKRPGSRDSSLVSPSKKPTINFPQSEPGHETDKAQTSGEDRQEDGVDGRSSLQVAQSPPLTEEELERRGLNDYKSEVYHVKIQQLPRRWELTEFGARQLADGDSVIMPDNSRRPLTFTIMSYNVLSQSLMNFHLDLYRSSSAQSLDWHYRRRRLLAEIAYHNVDILSLQEVQEDHYLDYIKPRLETLGYTGCYQKRTGEKGDGCATLWKRNKFELLQFTPVNYCRGGLLDRDNIAVIVVLRPLRDGRTDVVGPADTEDKLVIANTHLLFNPRRGDIKLAQLMILLAEIDKHAYLGPSAETSQPALGPSWDGMKTERYCPIIMTGDFNMEPHCNLYKLIISGVMDYVGLVVKDMSGQEEGWCGNVYFLQRQFMSPSYGVTDLCQYHNVVVDRLQRSYQTYSRESESQRAERGEGDSKDMQPHHHDNQKCDNQTESGKPAGSHDGQSISADSTADGKTSKTSVQARWPEQTESPYNLNTHTVPGKDSNTGLRLQTGGTRIDSLPVTPNSSGHLSHRLNLVSSYQHKIQRLVEEPEVTTHHSRAECTVDYIFYSVDYKDVYVENEEVVVRVVEEGHLRLMGRFGLMSGGELDKVGGIPNCVMPSDHLCLITKFLLL